MTGLGDAQDAFGSQGGDQAGHRAARAQGGDDVPDVRLLGQDLLTRLTVTAGAQGAGSAERHQIRHGVLAAQLGARLLGLSGQLRDRRRWAARPARSPAAGNPPLRLGSASAIPPALAAPGLLPPACRNS
ncbi:hypothetical protein [Streptomyces aidingensis]|uniref:Uncharacterized protein n=1 Tax=Streptomyces aidingensis TaxID=910347 RepID=A0A1I1N3V3_9ACTN|nr:hypothetical protein [Streptomyces aidingensis]SFC92299.1 hypothetical protein SAMN05421773_107210 [Streptomyces aidingensis]